jgi:hypothetical protein
MLHRDSDSIQCQFYVRTVGGGEGSGRLWGEGRGRVRGRVGRGEGGSGGGEGSVLYQ